MSKMTLHLEFDFPFSSYYSGQVGIFSITGKVEAQKHILSRRLAALFPLAALRAQFIGVTSITEGGG